MRYQGISFHGRDEKECLGQYNAWAMAMGELREQHFIFRRKRRKGKRKRRRLYLIVFFYGQRPKDEQTSN